MTGLAALEQRIAAIEDALEACFSECEIDLIVILIPATWRTA